MIHKKMLTKIMAIICSLTVTVTGIPVTSLNVQAADPAEEGNVILDSGGYKTELFGVGTDTWGEKWVKRSETLPPATTYLTDNYRETVGTVPTSDWASSVVFDQYSESLYAHPLAYRAASNGIHMAYPAVTDSTSYVDSEPMVESLLNDDTVELVVGADGFSAKDARVDKATDWTYDILLENSTGSSSIMATLAKGTPYAFYQFTNLSPTISLGAGGTDLTIFKNSTSSNVLGVSLTNRKDSKTHYYGIYAPEGTTWTNAGGKLTANMPAGNKYLSVAILPDNSEEAFALYESYAFNFITDTKVEWQYDENAALVSTTYHVTTTNMATGAEGGDTIIAMYPHQWRYTEAPLTGYTYKTIRGTMKTTIGSSYTTEMQYNGILTALPITTDAEAVGNIKDQLGYLWDYRKNKPDPKWICFLEGQYGGYDTYWVGKNLNTLAEAIFLANQFDDAEMIAIKNDIVEGVANYLQFWFNPYELYQNGDFVDDYFYYYQDYGTLIGYPASYSSDKEINDHHFHYGYWIKAAAAVAKNDPTWAENWGGMVYEMISDIANANRDGSSYNANSPAKYPFLRNFDIYEGHSWASGVANYEYDADGKMIDPNGGLSGGNNQESSSEAVNAWASLILWGEVVGDTRIRDLGVYMYTTEIAAVEDYYYDVHNEIFTDAYEDRDNFNLQTVTRLFGGRYDHTAWWTENSIEVTTITMLPLSGATLYMGKYKDKVKAVADSINETSKQWTYFLDHKDQSCVNFGKTDMLTDPETNQDVMAMYYAYYDADAAFNMWDHSNDGKVENGESRAHTWAYITSLKEYGAQNFNITGSSALSLVLEKDGVKTYVAENVTDQDERVYFSDGTYIDVPAHSQYQGPKTGDGENPGLRKKVSYTLESYMQNIDRTGYDCVITTEKADEGEFTLEPAEIDGFVFDATNVNNKLNATLVKDEDNTVTLKVYYNRVTYQINYELDGGTNDANNPTEYVYGSTVTLNRPTKSGYQFLGWYTDAEFTNKFTNITSKTSGNLHLYAKWIFETEAEYTVNVYKQNTSRNGYERIATYYQNGEIGQTASYVYTGDTTGFSKNMEKSVESGTIVEDNSLVLDIYYDRNTYTISYGNMDGATNAYGNASSYVYGVGMALVAPTKTGYTFGGWYTDAACTAGKEISEISATLLNNVEVYAKWTETPTGDGNEGNDNISNENITVSYNPSNKLVTISVNEPGLTGTTIAFVSKYSGETAETDAKTAAQTATDALPGINLPGNLGVILQTNENGASGEITNLEVNYNDWIVFGVNVGDKGVTTSTGFFYYKIAEEVKTSYTVNHYQQNASLMGYTLATSDTVSNVEIGSTVNATENSYEGFTYNSVNSVTSGTANVDGGLILSLYYDRNTYGISYNNMEGATNPNPANFVYGVALPLQEATKEGYTFAGWFSDAELTEENEVTVIEGNQTVPVILYAKWVENNPPIVEDVNYTVQYYIQNTELNGYTEVEEAKETLTAKEGTTVNAEIKSFTGFTHNAGVTGTVLSGTATEGLALKVYYDRNKYNITYHNVQQAVNPNATTYAHGVGMTLQPATKEGYTFRSWHTDASCSEESKITAIPNTQTGSIDLYASWEAISGTVNYTVSYYLQNEAQNGYVEVEEEREAKTATANTTVNAEVKSFTGFTHNSAVEGTVLSGTATEGLTLKVYYDRNRYTVTYHNVEGATNPNAATYVYGVGLVLKDASKDGFIFNGWYTDASCSTDKKATYVPADATGNKDFYASWEAEVQPVNYTIQYYVQNTSFTGYTELTEEKITRRANAGTTVNAEIKSFTGFTHNATVTGTLLSGTATEGLALKVYYDRNQYNLTYHNVEGATHTNPDKYVYGVGCTLSDAEKEGYVFGGWYKDAEYKKAISTISAVQTGDMDLYAKWDVDNEEYTVRYYFQNTALTAYEELTDLTVKKTAQRGTNVEAEVKSFDGFTHNSNVEGTLLSGTVDEGLVLKVYYDRNTYSITYENIDGALHQNPASYVYGVELKLKSATKEGYAFDGWYTNESCSADKRMTAISKTQTGNLTLYANWVDEVYAAQYTVEYYLQNATLDGYIKSEADTMTTYGEVNTTVNAFVRDFHGFIQNTTHTDNVLSGTVDADGSLVLKVYYDRAKFSITYMNMEGATFSEEPAREYTYGLGVTLPGALKSGYSFKGWYTDKNYAEASKISAIAGTSAENIVVYAKWAATDATYTVKHFQQNTELTGYSEVEDDTLILNAEAGEQVTALPKEYLGFTFNEENSTADGTVKSDGSLMLKLYYDRNTYAIHYHNMEGAVNHVDNKAQYVYNVPVSFGNPTKEGYVFGGWFRDEACTEENKISGITAGTMDDVDVYAKWIAEAATEKYRVEYYLENGSMDGYDVAEEETVELYGVIGETVNAPAKQFTGFVKNSEAEGAKESGVVEAGLLLKVFYDREEYSIIYHNVDQEGTKNPNPDTYHYGIGVSLNDPYREDYKFDGWYTSEGMEENKKISQISAEDTGNKVLWAKWISKKDLNWTVDKVLDQTYTGKKIAPDVVVRDASTNHKLQFKKDYTLKYSNNVNAGIATIEIIGKGNYTGTRYVSFNISPIDLEDNDDVYVGNIYKFANANGKEVKITPEVKLNGKKLKFNKDFKIDTSVEGSQASYTTVGEYELVLEGVGNYEGTLTTKVVMADKASTTLISKAKVTGLQKKLTFDESKVEYVQNLSLTYKSMPLVEGTHYELEYRNNTKAGTAEVIVKGLMNDPNMKFTGSKVFTYKIEGYKLTAKNVVLSQNTYSYRGYRLEPAVTVVNATGAPISEDNYSVTYSNNLNKGKGTITVTGKNACEGTVKKTFTITALPLTDGGISVDVSEEVPFVKSGATTNVVVTYNGEVLSPNVDYTLKYLNNKQIGNAQVTIIGTGNFAGSVSKNFAVKAKSLEDTTVVVSDAVFKNNAKMKNYLMKPVVLDEDGSQLSAGKDYAKVCTYELINDAGEATVINEYSNPQVITVGAVIRVTVTAAGGCYTDSNSAEYRIISGTNSIKDARVTIAPQTYTGQAVTISKADIIKVEIKKNGSYMTLDEDCYEILEGSYKNNVKPGNAKVTIRGVGEYGGSKEATFKIQPKSMDDSYFLSRIFRWLFR